MKSKSDPDFIQSSKDIADILADSQKRTNIPGGYIILLDALDEEKSIYIIIKAEPHQALQRVDVQSQISLLKSVFLSPSQKLYKIGILCERLDPSGENPSDRFECWLFDDQFRAESHPAEYFYKDFLGFTIGNNAKIQSQRFYDKTEGFIIDSFDDFQVKSNFSVLKQKFQGRTRFTFKKTPFL